MFFFDPSLYALLNADSETSALSIEAARIASAWLPDLSGLLSHWPAAAPLAP